MLGSLPLPQLANTQMQLLVLLHINHTKMTLLLQQNQQMLAEAMEAVKWHGATCPAGQDE